ncbi:MAG: Tfp pilus assembly protein FimT/FimU [Phycisphaerae bacterium]
MNRRKAYTYVEIAIVSVVVAILFVAAVPDGDSAAKEQGEQWTRRFEADVDYAKSLSIADPLDPVVIKVDVAGNRYWLARSSDPTTPILHPRTQDPYIVQSGATGTDGLEYVSLVATDLGGDTILKFDPLGGTDQNTNALFQIVAGNTDYEVAISPVSGKSTVQTSYSRVLTVDGGGTTVPLSQTGGLNTQLGP